MRSRIAPFVSVVAIAMAMFTPTVHAQTGSLGSTTAASISPDIKEVALEAYKNLDVDAARTTDPSGFDRRLDKLSSSPAMTEFLNRYSIDPSGELKRLAALMDDRAIDTFLAKTDGQYITPNTGPEGGLQLVNELPAPDTNPGGDLQPAATCWKSYVGIGAFTWVTGFYCALTGIMTFPCLWIAAIAGDKVNWDRYC